MNTWLGIAEFVAVVEAGSFTAAAERLKISNSQISKRISQLEDRLGVRLLNRTTRRIMITDEGEHYFQFAQNMLKEFQALEMAISSGQSEPRGKLKINIAGCFQERFVVPVLTEFLRANPKLSMQVDFTDKPVDILETGCDISICAGELKDSSLKASKLGDVYYQLVASPNYLQAHGLPTSLDDLKQHNCLSDSEQYWNLDNGEERIRIHAEGNWQSDNSAALLKASLQDLGIAQLPSFAVEEYIQKGELVSVLDDWNKFPTPVWIMYSQNRHLSAKIRLCIDFLKLRLGTKP